MIKSKLKKIGAVLLAAVTVMSTLAVASVSASAATTADYNSIESVVFNIHKGEVDETTEAADSEGHIGNTDTLTGTTTDEPSDFKGLAGATFKMYKVADINETFTGKTDDEKISAAWRIVNDKKIVGTTLPATDRNGLTNVTVQKRDFGLYLVTEITPTPAAVTTTAADFLVYLPMTAQNDSNTQGKTWLTTVDVYPKNLVTLGGAVLTKTINTAAYDGSALEQQPEFKIVEKLNDGSDYTIAQNIALSSEYKTVSMLTGAAMNSRYSTVTIAQKNGVIAVDGLPVGSYKFIETKAGRITGDTEDLAMDVTPREFSVVRGNNVDVTTSESGFGTIKGNARGLTVSLGNDNSRLPDVKKEVQKRDGTWTEDNGGTWSIDIENVVWKVTSTIPADMETYKKYTITDTIDERLDFVLTDDTVTVDESLNLTKGTDYTVNYDTATRVLTVDVTRSGCEKLGALEYKSKDFSFTFTTQINANAVVDEYIDNQAKLDYTNSYDLSGDKLTNKPKVRTGGINVLKVDNDTNQPMAGVEFTLRDADGNEVPVKKDSDGYYTADATGSSTVVTNADGKIYIKGLHYSEGDVSVYTESGKNQYTLTETKTNNGYQLLVKPMSVICTEGTYDAANSVTIKNVKQPKLPLTGGMGTVMFIIAGFALIGGAAFILKRYKAKKEEKLCNETN